ncbi:MAG: hypothetical protein L6W00_08630 [Lentisphaeria bacterium]|nr:MAG: hypothetical protein L6W00_08630 [Lentisphaeria bacterium]
MQSIEIHIETLLRRHPELAPAAPAIRETIEMILAAFRAGNTLFCCGNGGSSCRRRSHLRGVSERVPAATRTAGGGAETFYRKVRRGRFGTGRETPARTPLRLAAVASGVHQRVLQ